MRIIAMTLLAAQLAIGNPMPGADVSMLAELEKGGAKYFDGDKQSDAITILRANGCELFRLRLFVNPTDDFNKSWGATQNLEMMKSLAARIKKAGGKFMLDLHYSDTWADPENQYKPKAWEKLSFDDLEKQVESYTIETLRAFVQNGTPPDMVQIGNEITQGMIWPDGSVVKNPNQTPDQQWTRFARLLNAGIRGVRAVEPDRAKMRTIIHIHGGGQRGLPTWYFGQLSKYNVDFDIIGLSCYVSNGESFDLLKDSIHKLIEKYDKDVIVAEVTYPWKESDRTTKYKEHMPWTESAQGQRRFVIDLNNMLRGAPKNRGIAWVWWYPEATAAGNLHIWRDGTEALFDARGAALPAQKAMKDHD